MMKTTTEMSSLKDTMLRLYEEHRSAIFGNDNDVVTGRRESAMASFRKTGFPHKKLENWRNTDISGIIDLPYHYYFRPTFKKGIDLKRIFQCNIPNLQTDMVSQLNGWYISENGPLKKERNGVIVGSLEAVRREFPDLIAKHYGRYARDEKNGFVALNNAFAQDGVFILVPDNVKVTAPIQLVNIIHHDRNIFVQNHNLIILGKNSSLQLVQCDDSIDQQRSLVNTVTEIFLDENASLDHYKLQNKNDQSALINAVFFHLEKDATLSTNAITLNGGLIRNDHDVKFAGENSKADIMGLYLVDKTQHADNQVFVDHTVPNCQSNELFKGILDDSARGVFNGHVLVRPGAQKTDARQNNKNILLTDKAVINTKPFLEIYADDVKCSHGASIGQMDEEAMFYLRARGIGVDNARLLLMYAFAAEVINYIKIEALKTRVDDMVKKRLRGELSICDQCVLHCSTMEKPVQFDIDMSKI
jgi:Fe-S cluster assembly protein SufD